MTDVKVEQCGPAMCRMLPVTKEDREAAASAYFAWISSNPVLPKKMLSGQADDNSMVQAFARHRQAAEKAQQERDAGIAEDRMPAIQCMSVEPVVSACRDIATAIRSQGHE